jgi:hypothetical protein
MRDSRGAGETAAGHGRHFAFVILLALITLGAMWLFR